MRHIGTVEIVFAISGRGCVVLPGVPFSTNPPIAIGSELEFRNPSGSVVRTKIKGVEFVNRGAPSQHAPFRVGSEVLKEDIEPGAEFYLVSEQNET